MSSGCIAVLPGQETTRWRRALLHGRPRHRDRIVTSQRSASHQPFLRPAPTWWHSILPYLSWLAENRRSDRGAQPHGEAIGRLGSDPLLVVEQREQRHLQSGERPG